VPLAIAVKPVGAGSAPTVRVVDPATEPIVALIVAVPWPELVASPFEPVVLLTTATRALDVLHVTIVVMSFVLRSV
jgi:hypothetical protein